MQQKIWTVEDDPAIQELVLCALRSYGYEARDFFDGESLQKALETQQPDLFLLDVMLPGMSGMKLLELLKSSAKTARIPVIMLTAKSQESDKVLALDSGAHDYIVKPFGVMELLARIRAALRDKTPSDEFVIRAGNIEMDLRSRTVTCKSIPVECSLKEFELLKLFMQNPHMVLQRDDILNAVWGYGGETRTLDVHVRQLRQKLQDDAENPRHIITVRGVGYRFEG